MSKVIMGCELVGSAPKHEKIAVVMTNDGGVFIFTTRELSQKYPEHDWEEYTDEFIDGLIEEFPGFYEDLKKLFV